MNKKVKETALPDKFVRRCSKYRDNCESLFSICPHTRFLEEKEYYRRHVFNGTEWVHTLDQINNDPYLLRIYKQLDKEVRK